MIALVMMTITFPEGAGALLVVIIFSGIVLVIIRRSPEQREFLTNIFLVAVVIRLLFGIVVHVFELRDFFGGDALTYDTLGSRLADTWLGYPVPDDAFTLRARSTSIPGWGMNYVVGFLYLFLGRNIFAAQSFCAVVGAATVPMVYLCAKKLFENIRVAKFSAVAVALFPAFIIWSGQLLKDGLIVFLLVLAMTMVLYLQDKLNYFAVAALVFALFGILAIRFYIFYMVLVAVAGSFLIGVNNSASSIVRRSLVLILLGLGLTYFGAARSASTDIETYGNLEKVQNSRMDMSRSGGSGFNEDVDVSTTQGAISALPVGFAYLMLAPFPWQISSLRAAITVPEVLVWWSMLPLMVYGLWYAFRHKLRTAFPVLFFGLMLTLAYSLFQGNVGTAYRQRTQIQVFLFMFIGVGWTLYKEKKEDRKTRRLMRQHQLDDALRAMRMRKDV
jgi:4-amino-4-deoxy-L-arabinose transferase-like glycosyltransferase